jgi:hypothetical protein
VTIGASYDDADFERAVATVSAEAPRALVERLGLDWEHLGWVALGCAREVLAEGGEQRAAVVSYGGEAFTAGLLIGLALAGDATSAVERFTEAVDVVYARGRHGVIADYCDLASIARFETLYSDALVGTMDVVEAEREALRQPVTRIFEAGLATGLALAGA